MFEQSFVQPASRVRTGWSLMTSFGVQALMITAALAIPLVNPEMLPKALTRIALVAPPGPPPGPPPETPRVVAANRVQPREVTRGLIEPVTMPPKAVIVVDEPVHDVAAGNAGPGIPGGIGAAGGGEGSDFMRSLLTATQVQGPPVKVEPRPEPPKPPAAPIVVSKGVQEALILVKTIPVYPPLALRARIEGIVHLTALISRDGMVTQLKVISGHPMLVPAAIDAVRQWRYRPTLLSGVPTEVVTQVDVKFTLTR